MNLNSNLYSGGDASVDTLFNMDNIFGSSFADLLVGNDVNNVIYAGVGNDGVYGAGGNDVLNGGLV